MKYLLNKFIVILLMVILVGINNLFSQENSGFETGLKNWKTLGKVSIDQSGMSYRGNSCVKLESAGSEIFNSIPVEPLSIVQLNAFVKISSPGIYANCFIRFFNNNDELIIEYKSKEVKDINYEASGHYILAPPKTKFLTYGLTKNSDEGTVYGDEILLQINPGEAIIPGLPMIDIPQYLQPFWNSDTTINETVILVSENNSEATGKLLFSPDKIISVKSFDLKNSFYKGIDYEISNNSIIKIMNSAIPSVSDTFFSSSDLAWYNLQSKWIVVSYIHSDTWSAALPLYNGSEIPNTISKLTSKSTVRIVACGTSITRGMDVSGYNNIAPFMPTYLNMLEFNLKKEYGYNEIKIYNAGLPGACIDWMALYADEYINSLDPDLVIIDFGMNDFWRYTPEQYKLYVETIINKCKTHNGKVEFLLISPMQYDPDYISISNEYKTFYDTNLAGYNDVLQSLTTKGIINLDMTSLSNEIYTRKKAKDCIVNPLHPNDYLARWFAQGLSALLIKP